MDKNVVGKCQVATQWGHNYLPPHAAINVHFHRTGDTAIYAAIAATPLATLSSFFIAATIQLSDSRSGYAKLKYTLRSSTAVAIYLQNYNCAPPESMRERAKERERGRGRERERGAEKFLRNAMNFPPIARRQLLFAGVRRSYARTHTNSGRDFYAGAFSWGGRGRDWLIELFSCC